MRPLSAIRKELSDAEDSWIKKKNKLLLEIHEIQKKCPHPKEFLVVEKSDSEDDCDGPEIYEHTMMSVECTLCEKLAFSGPYNKKSNGHPNPEDVIHERL